MLQEIDNTKRRPLHYYLTSGGGNAVAHSRPISLQHFIEGDAKGNIVFLAKPRRLFRTDHAGFIYRVTAAHLLQIARVLVDHLDFDPAVKDRVYDLSKVILPKPFSRPPT